MNQHESSQPGTVYLVGAGPGAPDLVTVRGLAVLRRADVVVYDALAHPQLVNEAPADAERVYAGKRGYCVGSTLQETIHEVMANRARAGLTVVRLKGGDPCVFGRGGEEAEYLAERGIPVDIVPGVTTAVGACAAAGIPLTHRDDTRAVTLVTGHFDPDSPDCTLDWAALARVGTLVVYMGLRHLDAIAARLARHGLSPDTPAAVVCRGTLPDQRVIEAPLEHLPAAAHAAGASAPAVIVIGAVVAHRARLLSLASAASEGASA